MGRRRRKGASPFMERLAENRKGVIIAAAAAILLIAAVVVIAVFVGRGAKETSSEVGTQTEAAVENQEQTAAETQMVPLEEEAYPEIHALMEQYYQAMTDGDADTIKALCDSVDDETVIYLQKRSNYIEAYQNLICYTKAGLEENSYVVYASYEIKFKDLEQTVPGVSPYLIYTRQDGSLYIHEGEVNESVNAYLEEISAQDDVVDLMNRIQVQFNEAVVADEELNNCLAEMKESLKVEVGEALAQAESEAAAEQAAQAGEQTTGGGEVKAIDVVNVRESDSEQAQRIGKVQIGDVLTLVESQANGWSKVIYEGKEAYIKSEFLEIISAEPVSEGDDDAQQDSQDGGAAADAAGDLPASGKIKAGDTINVRESASQNADKVGVCYKGETLEIIQHQADGWTKVKFNGKTGYVKTDVLKVLE